MTSTFDVITTTAIAATTNNNNEDKTITMIKIIPPTSFKCRLSKQNYKLFSD